MDGTTSHQAADCDPECETRCAAGSETRRFPALTARLQKTRTRQWALQQTEPRSQVAARVTACSCDSRQAQLSVQSLAVRSHKFPGASRRPGLAAPASVLPYGLMSHLRHEMTKDIAPASWALTLINVPRSFQKRSAAESSPPLGRRAIKTQAGAANGGSAKLGGSGGEGRTPLVPLIAGHASVYAFRPTTTLSRCSRRARRRPPKSRDR